MDLFEAAREGNITAVIKALKGGVFKKGADVNAKYFLGWTALTSASKNGHTETVKLLIEKGADVNAKNILCVTALTLASIYGHTEIISILKTAGAW